MITEPITMTPEQAFEGHAVGVGGKACCTDCKRTVRSGDLVGVYVYRTSDATLWDVARLSCAECRRSAIDHPTLGAAELMLHARLGVTSDSATQSSRLTLWGMDAVDYNPPKEGAQP